MERGSPSSSLSGEIRVWAFRVTKSDRGCFLVEGQGVCNGPVSRSPFPLMTAGFSWLRSGRLMSQCALMEDLPRMVSMAVQLGQAVNTQAIFC